MFTNPDVSVAYICFDYKDRKHQTNISLLSSLVKQVALQLQEMPAEVKELYARHERGQSSVTSEESINLLLSLSKSFRRSFILVDALDQNLLDYNGKTTWGSSLLSALLRMQGQSSGGRAYSMFLTSRMSNILK